MKTRKWIKLGIEYGRDTDLIWQTHNQMLHAKQITFENVKHAVKKWVETWTGRGEIKILNFSTGPFSGDQLSDKQEAFFVGKTYNFKK